MLLHLCCAPCSPYVVETLRRDYDLTLYFYNPNIHPESEHDMRLDEVRDWANRIDLPLLEEPYDADNWFAKTEGLEDEPERGARCDVCFEMRLSGCAEKASEMGVRAYGTVLTVSPHKSAAVINRIGSDIGGKSGVEFICADWKKKDGYKITTRMAREQGFYRQDYCGCVYSKKPKDRSKVME